MDASPFPRPKALLIDGDDVARIVGRISLETLGYWVVCATSAAEAVAAAKMNSFQIVLIDTHVEDANSVVDKIDKSHSGATRPRFFAVVHDGENEYDDFTQFDGILTKPLDLEALRSLADRYKSVLLNRSQ